MTAPSDGFPQRSTINSNGASVITVKTYIASLKKKIVRNYGNTTVKAKLFFKTNFKKTLKEATV